MVSGSTQLRVQNSSFASAIRYVRELVQDGKVTLPLVVACNTNVGSLSPFIMMDQINLERKEVKGPRTALTIHFMNNQYMPTIPESLDLKSKNYKEERKPEIPTNSMSSGDEVPTTKREDSAPSAHTPDSTTVKEVENKIETENKPNCTDNLHKSLQGTKHEREPNIARDEIGAEVISLSSECASSLSSSIGSDFTKDLLHDSEKRWSDDKLFQTGSECASPCPYSNDLIKAEDLIIVEEGNESLVEDQLHTSIDIEESDKLLQVETVCNEGEYFTLDFYDEDCLSSNTEEPESEKSISGLESSSNEALNSQRCMYAFSVAEECLYSRVKSEEYSPGEIGKSKTFNDSGSMTLEELDESDISASTDMDLDSVEDSDTSLFMEQSSICVEDEVLEYIQPAEFYNKSDLRYCSTKLYPCTYCRSIFNSKFQLKVHLGVHSGKTPFPCNLCSAKFNQKCHLDNHLETHFEKKQFLCAHCPSGFAIKANLKDHIRNHEDKNMSCTYCSSKFKDSTSWKDHIVTHFSERAFS